MCRYYLGDELFVNITRDLQTRIICLYSYCISWLFHSSLRCMDYILTSYLDLTSVRVSFPILCSVIVNVRFAYTLRTVSDGFFTTLYFEIIESHACREVSWSIVYYSRIIFLGYKTFKHFRNKLLYRAHIGEYQQFTADLVLGEFCITCHNIEPNILLLLFLYLIPKLNRFRDWY